MPDRLTRREVDARVAKTLGFMRKYTWRTAPRHQRHSYWLDFVNEPEKQLPWHPSEIVEAPPEMEMYSDGWRAVPHYSTDVAAAFAVVEKMKRHPATNTDGKCFDCCIVWDEEAWEVNFGHFDAESESLPLAICLAALRAHGIDVELAEEK